MELSEEETFIDLWQQKPCLYDISNQSYSNKKKKSNGRHSEEDVFRVFRAPTQLNSTFDGTSKKLTSLPT